MKESGSHITIELLTTTSMEHLLKSTWHSALAKSRFSSLSTAAPAPHLWWNLLLKSPSPGISPLIGSEGSEPWFRTGSTVYRGRDELLARKCAFLITQLWHQSHIFDPKHISWLPSEQFHDMAWYGYPPNNSFLARYCIPTCLHIYCKQCGLASSDGFRGLPVVRFQPHKSSLSRN